MKNYLKQVNWSLLVMAILLPQSLVILGSFFIKASIPNWYATLEKPTFNPPNEVFTPVWIFIYSLIGLSLYFILEKWDGKKTCNKEICFFSLQLFLNFLWSFIFFGLQSPLLAFIEILLLIGAIIATMYYARRVSEKAFWLLVPYLLWVIFLAILNFSIWQLN